MVNFTQCAIDYINNTELIAKYGWTGPVKGIQKNPLTQITYAGCVAVCGTGNEWYPWSQSSNTITTWILPIIGMLLQAPFESNAFWRTMLAIARWVGSPISSLSYILWNISVTGKCALMGTSLSSDLIIANANRVTPVDMAVPYDYDASAPHSEFGNIRDSFYILTSLNQYSIKSVVSLKDEAEGLLRIVLFSKDLRLAGTTKTLRQSRQDLAQSLRKRRRRGVVPVFISTMWFLFSLAISVQSAFGMIGENSEAHDLALGLLLGWLPILILCSIVDRNPAAADDVRELINDLIDLVCKSLQDETIVNEFIESFCTSPEAEELKARVEKIRKKVPFLQSDFLTAFAGQGRVRWHYGAAHPILSDIENCYVAEHGRSWLRNEEEARTKLVLGSIDRGLFWFDFRELWQISSAVVVVVGTCMGAFALSFFTPTVGLGCRSLGYLIFVILSSALLLLEFLVWWFTAEETRVPDLARRRFTSTTFVQMEERGSGILRRMKSWSSKRRDWFETFLLGFLPAVAAFFQPSSKRTKTRDRVRKSLDDAFTESHNFTIRQWTHRFFFIPVEIINAAWLVYIILAQTFGSYSNCKCSSSIYGFGGGYIDLTQDVFSDDHWLKWYWSVGTSLSVGIMGVGLCYVVLEVCISLLVHVRPRQRATC
jgi:hypothetical protein